MKYGPTERDRLVMIMSEYGCRILERKLVSDADTGWKRVVRTKAGLYEVWRKNLRLGAVLRGNC